ncbi:60S ribosomal protein L7-1-like [Hibiscus syriacus]|uniref:60S ribosomal protein L7-1-like n=1 Tax=Hibiscus syriacus TaxID=106335 RepID=UPI001924E83A|nr:60S ribosomal protein L7-1-like [Hibiscus syriacus]
MSRLFSIAEGARQLRTGCFRTSNKTTVGGVWKRWNPRLTPTPERFFQLLSLYQELDLIRMKQRAKMPKSVIPKLRSKLLFIIRIQGKNDMHPKTRNILYRLRLRKVFSGLFVKATEGVTEMLQKVEPYVTYGYGGNFSFFQVPLFLFLGTIFSIE